jgi:hypothetical protein
VKFGGAPSSNIKRKAHPLTRARPSQVCFVLPVATLVMFAVPLGVSMHLMQAQKTRERSLNILNLQPLGQREPERHDNCDV